MAIDKPGFTPGFRGRQQASSLGRRAYYLAAEHDRYSARLLGPDGRLLSPREAIELMGGPEVAYHELILAPSASECRSVASRKPNHPRVAIEEAGLRVLKAQAQGRRQLLAIHEQDGRFHFHLVIFGPMPERALGRQGSLQKQWRREMYGDEPRIQDWAAHQRFKTLKAELQALIEAQRALARERREAIRGAAHAHRQEVGHGFDRRLLEILEARRTLELAAIQARYEARGTLGSPRHLAEMEQAEHRHTTARRSLDRRMQVGSRGHSPVRATATRVVAQAERVALGAAEQALGLERLPEPARKGARVSMILAAGAITSALRSPHRTNEALPVARPALKPTGLQVAHALTHALPDHDAAQVAGSLARTALRTARDLATCPPKVVATLAQGAVDLALTTTRKMGERLPPALEKAFEAAGWVPGIGLGAKALQKGVELAHPKTPSSSRGPEVER